MKPVTYKVRGDHQIPIPYKVWGDHKSLMVWWDHTIPVPHKVRGVIRLYM